MADLNFDRGTVKLVESPDGPVLVESTGFFVLASCATQDEARRAKALLREAGFPEADYGVGPAVLV